MKTRIFVLAMTTLMLSAGPAMAMDSEYLEKRRQQIYEVSGQIAAEVTEQSRRPDERRKATEKRSVRTLSSEDRGEDRTSKILDPWWR